MLNSRQRASLRSLANSIDTVFQIGKDGIGEKLIKSVSDCIEARELIKLRVLENSGYTAIEAAREIAEKIDAEVVAAIGSRFILYKPSKEKKISI